MHTCIHTILLFIIIYLDVFGYTIHNILHIYFISTLFYGCASFLSLLFFSFFKTKADILAFETLEQVVEGKHNELWDFPNVRSLWIRVRESSNVANYLISKQRMIQTKEDAVQYKKSVNKTMGR